MIIVSGVPFWWTLLEAIILWVFVINKYTFEIVMQGSAEFILNEFQFYSCNFTHSIHHPADRCVAADSEIAEDQLQASQCSLKAVSFMK
jgi:hypothetical protein